MRVPVSWLRDYVPLEMPARELADRLVISTCEVDGIETVGVADVDGNLGLFRVGRVLDAVKHPNADRLQLCQVDVGETDPRQIVCGAWNFGAGATVGVALPGAVLPNGLQLEQRKVRGEVSDGMILAEDEIELGTDHSGIMVLSNGIEPGTPLGDVLPLADTRARARDEPQPPRSVGRLRDRARGRRAVRSGARAAAGHRPARRWRPSPSTSRSKTSRAVRGTSAASSPTRPSARRQSG